MQIKISKKGFTLIELLVVIAIIGILASIVLVSFPSATKKANDSRVEAAISQMRALMTSYNAANGAYTGFDCASPSEMVNLCADVKNKDYGKVDMTLNVSADAVCMYAPLNTKDGASFYCADSAGTAGIPPEATAPSTTCNDTSFTCPPGTTL